MPVCDGLTCNNSVPWRITTQALQLSNRNVPFKSEEVAKRLRQVLGVLDVQVHGVGSLAAVIKNFCPACWKKQAAAWGDVGTYLPARARTTAQGCFFQIDSPVFYVNKAPDPERILSCVVHELMHYWSFRSEGLQNFNRTLGVDWDEAVADLLGYRTYKDYYQGDFQSYFTPYNQYPKCIEKVGTQIEALPKFKYEGWTGTGAAHNGLPIPELRAYIRLVADDANMDQRLKKPKIAMKVQELLFRALVTWFFDGPETTVMGMTCRDFLKEDGIKKLITPSLAFPGYGGGQDTQHAI